MLKPLLRTIPTMSGNVKLACNLLDYRNVGPNQYETEIRYAKLLPLSSTLYQHKVEAELTGGSWEYDLRKYYAIYNDVFFDPYFNYNKGEILKIDKTTNQYVRNNDFEMGVKRISWVKNGCQFAFFAPFYFEGIDDLPKYFNMTIRISTAVHSIVKNVKINITDNAKSVRNYLYHYLTKYAKNIDSNVCFMLPDSKQATYYGIDLIRGGFVKTVDNGVSKIYTTQTTINNFDATICTGFKRNKMVMKQVMPLAFYFNIDDLLTPAEHNLYRNGNIEFSGYYVNSKNIGCSWYDFNVDYDLWKESILALNDENGLMQWFPGKLGNIMDGNFPSLNDMRYIEYQYSNKLTANYCRWKLKYSSDEHPFITNLSAAFSKNQGSNYKYGQYPVSFSSMDGLALPILHNSTYYYNLIFPLSSNTKWYDLYNASSTDKYQNIFNNYCLNWFNVIDKVDDSLFRQDELWQDVVDNCVYYNGVLYDLSNIYYELVDPEKIDKFAMFVKTNLNFMNEQEIGKLKFANYMLNRQVVERSLHPNALSNLHLLNWGVGNDGTLNYKNYLYDNEQYTGALQDNANKDSLEFNKIFTYSENNTGHYINLADYDMDYYELNKYYDYDVVSSYINDMRENFFDRYQQALIGSYAGVWDPEFRDIVEDYAFTYMGIFNDPSSYMISSYEILPINRSYMISYHDKIDINTYAYIADLRRYTAYEYEYENVTRPDGTHDSYIGYYYMPIEGQFNSYGLIEGTDEEYKYMKDNFFYVDNDNYSIKKPSFSTYYNSYTGNLLSYFSCGKYEYLHTLYGSTFYTKRNAVRASELRKLEYEPFQQTYLRSFCNDDVSGIYKYGWINDPTNITYKLYKTCQHTQELAASLINAYLDTCNIYEFNPVLHNNAEIYTSNVFKKRYNNIGKFYGDHVAYSEVKNDKNVLYASRYNLNAIFKRYSGVLSYSYFTTYTDADGNVLKDYYESKNTYTYDWIYDVAISTYQCSYEKKYNIPYMVTYNYDNIDNANNHEPHFSFNHNQYTELYCKFLNKRHIYYWYGELSKNEELKFPDNWAFDWKRNIFIKRRVLAHTENGLAVQDEFVPLVEAGYLFAQRVDPEWFLSFKKFYANILEDTTKGLYYFAGYESEKFELVYKDIFFRVNKTLWDIIGCEDTHYKDIYLYRIENPLEYDQNYVESNIKTSFIGYDTWSTYSGRYSDLDCTLTPLFYDIFEQDELDEAIYANYKLHNISKVEYSWPEYDSHDDLVRVHYDYNYRYNCNDTLYMVSITDDERVNLGLDKTYEEYSYCGSDFSIEVNDLNYNTNLNMSTYKDANGINYGFYVIQANIDNTSNSFRVDAQTSLISKSTVKQMFEYINNINSIYYINGVNIVENPDYGKLLFKNYAPFLNLNLLNNLNNISTVLKPNSFNTDMIYKQQLIDNTNGSYEINLSINDPNKITKQNLFRYTHNIVPYITERNILSNYYYLKLKDVEKTLLDTGRFNSIGDSPIYKKTIYVDSFTPYNVYTLSPNTKEVKHYNNVSYKYTPLEYKHFNASKYINIESEFFIRLDGKYTYEQLHELETEEHTISMFAGYMNTGRVTKFDENEILFLYRKYKVEYDSKSVGLDYTRTEKLYTLTYKFSLL